jgi:5-methylcytosine-specific restriction endonuclease McrA
MSTPKQFTNEELRIKKNEKSKQRYIENKEKIAAYHAALYLKKLADPEFKKKNAEKAKAYRAANPHMVKDQNRKRREKNPEAERARCRAWFELNPDKRAAYEQNRRAKKQENGGKITPNLKNYLFIAQKGHCMCCRKKCQMSDLHMDHVMPLSKGGAHIDENIQLLCQPCNQSKYSKHPIDFMQERGFLL